MRSHATSFASAWCRPLIWGSRASWRGPPGRATAPSAWGRAQSASTLQPISCPVVHWLSLIHI
eukprot:4376046-Alexandrium_andersonii.AAC.1